MVRKVRFQLWLSISLLLLMLAGFAGFGYWSRVVLANRLVEQTLADNRTIGVSALGLLNQPLLLGQGIEGVKNLLQHTCDLVKLPNNGYICAIDSQGTLIAYPNKTPQDSINVSQSIYMDPKGVPYNFSEFFQKTVFEGYYQKDIDTPKEVLVAINYPRMGIKLMVHQDYQTLTEQTEQKLQELWPVMFLFVISITAIAYWAVSKQVSNYEMALENKQKTIQMAMDKVADKHEELVRKHEELELSHKETDGLMSILAHDMQAPLNKINGLIDITKRTGALSAEQDLYIKMMGEIVQDAKSLISDILEMASIENSENPINNQEIDVTGFFERCLSPFAAAANKKGVFFEKQLLTSNVIIKTDPSMLQRILDNLVSNAIKFTPQEKKVAVVITIDSGVLHVAISDEGPGIKKEEQHLLFRKFQQLSAKPTNKEASTGLGLYIVRILLERINGSITLDSTEGVGSTFHVRIFNL